MLISRKMTKAVSVGPVKIGGGHPITIQSMTNTDTRNIPATIGQILLLAEAGCEIIRVAVPDTEAAEALKEIKKASPLPVVADIHFDYRLALAAIEAGVDKLRINPGNIGGSDRVKQIVHKAKERKTAIRIGVNAGSLEKELLAKYGGVTAEGLVESVMNHGAILEGFNFEDIVLSVKASSVPLSLEAHRLLSDRTSYPLHIGITESGTVYGGSVKSAVGIGILLAEGIGDTLRVSLTGDPAEELRCAKEILQALEIRKFGVEFISCPTCGRTEVNLIELAKELEHRCKGVKKNIKVAVMGCAVNGPGEAREADIGIACGKGCGVIFKKGEIIRKVPEAQLISEFMGEMEKL